MAIGTLYAQPINAGQLTGDEMNGQGSTSWLPTDHFEFKQKKEDEMMSVPVRQ